MASQTINIVLKLHDGMSSALRSSAQEVDNLSNSFKQLDNIITKNNKMQSANLLKQRFNQQERYRLQDLNNEKKYQRSLSLENQRSANRLVEISARIQLARQQGDNIFVQGFNTRERLRIQDLNSEKKFNRDIELEQLKHQNKMSEITARSQLYNNRKGFKFNFLNNPGTSYGSKISNIVYNSGSGISNIASGIYIVKNIIDATSSVITSFTDRADKVASQKAILGMYNTTGYSTNQVYDYLTATALQTRSDLGATADLTNALLAAGVYQGPNAAINTIDTVGLINKSLIAGGTRGQQADSVLLQLSQGLAQGQLQGQELRAIRQYAPYMGNIIAEGLNMQGIFDKEVTFGDLKDLGAEGELTADRLLKAFELMSDKINADFETMPKTWGQAMTSLSTIWDSFIGKLNEGDTGLTKLNETMNGFVDYLMSADSSEFWEGMSTGINTLLNVLNIGLNAVISGITWLGQNLESVLAVASILLTILAIGWIATNWQILAVIAVIYTLITMFSSLGISGSEVLATIVGILAVVISTVERLTTAVGSGLAAAFETLGSIALGVLGSIATAIGKILDALGIDWGASLMSWGQEKTAESDALKSQSKEHWNEAKEALFGGKSVGETYTDAYNAIMAGMDNIKNLASNVGNFDTSGIGSGFGGGFGTGGIADTYVTGGSLDSGGEVQLSNEDIKLLRDIAARDFLLNVSTITPTVTNNFGDIRETADVNKILDEIERMVDEELATSVVMG